MSKLYTTKYILIGGQAVNLYGYCRNTNDIDIIVPFDIQNTNVLIRILTNMGYNKTSTKDNRELGELLTLSPVELHRYSTICVEGAELWPLDILFTTQYNRYNELVRIAKYEGIKINLIDLQDLFIMKRRAGRLQDKLDIENLTEGDK